MYDVTLVALLAFMLVCNAYFVSGWLIGALRARREGRSFGSALAWVDLLLVHVLILVFGALTAVDWARVGIVPATDVGDFRRLLLYVLFALKSGIRAYRFLRLTHTDVDGVSEASTQPAGPDSPR